MPFTFKELGLEGLLAIEPACFDDERGSFMETYKESDFARRGIAGAFVQDNHSVSRRGVVRGLHFQRSPRAQGKLIRVVSGEAWDVAVDLRPASTTYGKWETLTLSESNRIMLYVPPGFAHGFLSLSENTELVYKCTAEYDPGSDAGVRWNDPDIGIDWPMRNVVVSAKDTALPFLRDLARA